MLVVNNGSSIRFNDRNHVRYWKHTQLSKARDVMDLKGKLTISTLLNQCNSLV